MVAGFSRTRYGGFAMDEFRQFDARTLRGEQVSLSRYDGKVVLVVNTASKCGFTPQYAGLERCTAGTLRQASSCWAFLQSVRAPGAGRRGCHREWLSRELRREFSGIRENRRERAHAHPLFNWLTAQLPGLFGRKVKWNFTKFLIGRDGVPLRRFSPKTAPEKIDADIRKALAT